MSEQTEAKVRDLSNLRRTIKISDDAHIGGSIWMEPHTSLGAVEAFPNCRIGMHSYIVSGLMRSSVSIGRYCSIGRGVAIGTGEHALEALSTGGPIQNKYRFKNFNLADREKNIRTIIDHDVWIGDKATVFSGVTVGMGSVIGTGAVVTADIPPYSVAVGVPARVIKFRFEDHIIQKLIESKWFNFDVEDILSIYDGSIENFLDRLKVADFDPVFSENQYIEIPRKMKNSHTKQRIDTLESIVNKLNAEITDIHRKLNER